MKATCPSRPGLSRPGPARLRRAVCGLTAAVLPLLAGSCYLFPREEKILAPPLIEAPEISYEVKEVERKTIEKTVMGSGTMVSVVQVDHYFEHRGGRLRAVYVRVGERVEAGDLVAVLHTENLEDEIEQQKLLLRKAEINYERLVADAEDDTAAELAALDVESARLALADAEAELAEARRVADIDGSKAAQRRVRELESALEHRRIALRKAEIQHRRIQGGAAAGAALQTAALDIELSRLKLRGLERELAHARLTASVNGQVVYVNTQVTEGDYIDAYRTVATIADPEALQVQYSGLNVDEFELGRQVDVRIDEETYSGKVVMTPGSLPYDADESLREKIRIQVEDLPPGLDIGSIARISYVVDRKEDVLVLPRRLVMRYGTRRYVRVLVDGLKQERDVQIGLETPTEVEIVKGLEEGDLAIVR